MLVAISSSNQQKTMPQVSITRAESTEITGAAYPGDAVVLQANWTSNQFLSGEWSEHPFLFGRIRVFAGDSSLVLDSWAAGLFIEEGDLRISSTKFVLEAAPAGPHEIHVLKSADGVVWVLEGAGKIDFIGAGSTNFPLDYGELVLFDAVYPMRAETP